MRRSKMPPCPTDPRDIVKWREEVRKLFPLENLVDDIYDTLEHGGQYCHNIVSIQLRKIAKIYGIDAANNVVDTLALDEILSIKKVKSDENPE